jgi:biopolymer transport protein ExbD
VVPGRELPASRLVEIGRALRAAGAERVVIVTERALP